MPNPEAIAAAKAGTEEWHSWRKAHPTHRLDLVGADLSGAMLAHADLQEAFLSRACFEGADLTRANLAGALADHAVLHDARLNGANLRGSFFLGADLQNADLPDTNLRGATLDRADLRKACLVRADMRCGVLRTHPRLEALDAKASSFDSFRADRRTSLRYADLTGADLSNADLSGADLTGATLASVALTRSILVETDLTEATLDGSSIYGISAWDLRLEQSSQKDLKIHTDNYGTEITVDNLEVAQFIYLLLKNEGIRHVIDAITSKAVLILGRFTPERKSVLDLMREELRARGYLPILFDFEAPDRRDLTETVATLAHLARFVIADITDAKSIPQELQAIVPSLPSLPVQPLLQRGAVEYGMFEHFRRYPWVLDPLTYDDAEHVRQAVLRSAIDAAESNLAQQRSRSLP